MQQNEKRIIVQFLLLIFQQEKCLLILKEKEFLQTGSLKK